MTQKRIYLPDDVGEVVAEKKRKEVVKRNDQPELVRHTFHNVDPSASDNDTFLSFKVAKQGGEPIFTISENALKKAKREAKAKFAKAAKDQKAPNPNDLAAGDDTLKEATRSEPDDGVCDDDPNFRYQCGHRRHELVIKRPLKVEPEQMLVISYSYQVTRRYSDLITFQTPYPTRQFSFRVTKGEGVADLYFEVDSSHRLVPIRTSPGDQQLRSGETYKYELPAAVLPGQGIELYWYPWPHKDPPK